MAAKDHVTVVKDNVDAAMKAIEMLTKKSVLVGIPSTTAGRKDAGPITNAVLGYVHEFGEPKHNVPARPFLIPGVKSVEKQTAAGMQRAGAFAIEGKTDDMLKQLNAVGLRAVSAVKKQITSNIPPPLQPATVAARLRRTQGGRKRLTGLRSQGTNLGKWGATNLTTLVDTGQLRNSITYVIRDMTKAKP